MNLQQALKNSILELKKSGIVSAELDAKIILRHILDQDDTFIYAHPDFCLTNSMYSKFRKLIRERLKNKPIAYIIREKEFFGLSFYVNKNVLIPRPETEEMVEKAIELIQKNNFEGRIIDVGTGSGNIIISIAKTMSHNNNVALYATDISRKALYVAKKNARLHNCNEIKFYHSDLFLNRKLPKRFELILANLPYVPMSATSNQFANEEIDFEPKEAIFSPDNGSGTIKKFLEASKKRLSDGGVILIELDPRNAKMIQKYAQKKFGSNFQTEIRKDLSGKNRFLRVFPTTIPPK